MTEPTPPPRRPLATFLRAAPEKAAVEQDAAEHAAAEQAAAEDARDTEVPDVVVPDTEPASTADAPVEVEEVAEQRQDLDDIVDDDDGEQAQAAPAVPVIATPAPSFTRAPAVAPRTPRWQWGLVAGLVVLLSLQIAVADRARLAADAGSRPWVAGLCTVLRCSLPPWHEPTAFSMISRDVRPVPTQAGALQVQASFRNDARWAQGWPSLRLSLSDADGRVIGTSVFTPQDYLDPAVDDASVLEPGQSAQIAFRVREPAASTVAFTFEFL